MTSISQKNNSLVMSYLGLRKAIGIIGLSLPFVLVIGNSILTSSNILSSISSYYYSIMGDVFVGSLFAIGVFLFSYRGYERKDDLAGDLACVFAIGVALFPTSPDMGATQIQTTIGIIHLLFAAGFFLTLAYFAIFLFCKTNPNKPPTNMKLVRNRVYQICGWLMIICLAIMILIKVFPNQIPTPPNPIFWLETIAILAFGISWLVKGESILKDEVIAPSS